MKMASSILLQSCKFSRMRMLSNTMASSILLQSCKLSKMASEPRKVSSPYLLLPSSYEAGYKEVYSLAEKEVVSIDKAAAAPAWAQGGRVKHVGCSHGWVASFNEENRQAFLFNPLTGSHIKLPDIDHATRPINIILSSSPDAHDCRAIMRHAPSSGIAVCSPAHTSTSWVPVCGQGEYHVIGYSARQSRLFCVTNQADSFMELECWDLHRPRSPLWNTRMYTSHGYEDEHYHCPRYLVIDEHSQRLFLVIRVVTEEGGEDEDWIDDTASFCKFCGNLKVQFCTSCGTKQDDRKCLFLDSYTTCPRLQNWSHYMVDQALLDIYVTKKRNGDISEDEEEGVDEDEDEEEGENEDEDEEEEAEEEEKEEAEEEEENGGSIRYSHKTIRFHAYEFDCKKGEMRCMEASLDGLAMFVGGNHSFALPAADFNLSPDSIYFTPDGVNYISQGGRNDDVGIYSYVDGKISSIDCPCESQISTTSTRIAPPMWLTPN